MANNRFKEGEKNMFKKMLKNEKGLTLIELLAVIVILGIIAAIAIPSIGGIIQKSREDAVKADAVQVLNAAKIYMSSNTVDESKVATIQGSDLTEYVDIEPGKFTITNVKYDKGVYTLNGSGKAGAVTIEFKDATLAGIKESKDKPVSNKITIEK
ncbi:prepilin-type N-terminal cleavage/methylation domain-containing protein [Bacillus sp. CGMCC 1.16541]|uniref:prepilin-type N-terminal cleavage/methylation domain-containing protein n=1 Tax=Bacillus sp. CGMCC 1.16541 TaxID=2185143 RepID=UPI001EF61C23|nr:prepilin-type N-terminal cleavage/methylation domain-containing protein [Bacillus sp. CGMCC 1.16541]